MELMDAIEANGLDIVVLYSLERLSGTCSLLALGWYLNKRMLNLIPSKARLTTQRPTDGYALA